MYKPKKRNRNIKSFSPLQNQDFPQYSIINDGPAQSYRPENGQFFGEVITPPLYKPDKYDVDTESVIYAIDEMKLVKSVSSSPSWSDDNDTDASRKVQDEIERMDRVLRGVDPIPIHYDIDEYKQWMETFPDLSLFGNKEYGPYKLWKNIDNPTNSVDLQMENKTLKQYKTEIKRSVLHNIYENISIRLNSRPITSEVKTQEINFNRTKSYLNDCLKNSPFDRVIRDRNQKSRFISRQNSMVDNVKESPRNFQSLPLVFEEINHKGRVKPVIARSNSNETKFASYRIKSKKSFVLPPINDDRNEQFRSTSAAPLYSSLLSAKSNKFSARSRQEL